MIKNEQYHCFLHIQISLESRFQLKVKFFIFRAKFAQKGYFQSKIEKLVKFYSKNISGQKKKKRNEHHHLNLHI